MPRKSKIDALPLVLRDAIRTLRDNGATVDAIWEHLKSLDVSVARSTAALHVAKIDKLGEKLRQTKQISEVLVSKFGKDTDNRLMEMNIQLAQPLIMDILLAAADDGKPDIDVLNKATKSMKDVAQARRADVAVNLVMYEKFEAAALKAIDAVAKKKGLTSDTVDAIKAEILGIKAPAKEPAAEAQP